MHPKLHLPNVTLITATSIDIENTHAVLLHCASQIGFGAVKMLCPALPAATAPGVQYIQIPAMDFLGYSKLMIEGLNAFVDTSHCLVVQADGFILDPARWDDKFLDYDYVGAPWPQSLVVVNGARHSLPKLDRNSVGNGGFSLRSKKLLEITSRLRFENLKFEVMSEDFLICHYLYDDMLAAGVRFAPLEVAARFSIEAAGGPYGQTFESVFGFHGKHWLDRYYRERST